MEHTLAPQYTKAVERKDGLKLTLEVKQKTQLCKKRKVKTWSPEEDQQLIELYEAHPKKWATIASLMSDRNQNQCLHRYRRIVQNGAHRKIWSAEEDESIRKMMKKVGKNWKLLSQMLGTKTGKQIRERFINKLDPRIKKEDWTDQEDRTIIELYCLLGRKWSEISKHLPGRPENKIKNRFYSYIQKNYDIQCTSINDEDSSQPPQQEAAEAECQDEGKRDRENREEQKAEFERKQLQAEERTSFKDIFNQMQRNMGSLRDTYKEDKGSFVLPSINQLDFEMKMEDFGDENVCKGSRNVVGSMIRIEEEWAGKQEKDCYNFGGNTQFQSDFFYLSGN